MPTDPEAGSMGIKLPIEPAGTALLDRTVAARTLGGLVVSTPSGVRADVLDATGAVLESLPLTDGTFTGGLTNPDASTSVRIVDTGGDVAAETVIIGPR